jgi:hypothetical protein
LVESSNLHGGKRGGRMEEGEFFTVWRSNPGEMIEEREGEGVKSGFLLLWPHRLKLGVTGQTGDGHQSDR